MAFGNKKVDRRLVCVEFEHVNRTYRFELPGTEYDGTGAPHPLKLIDYFSGLWKFTDMLSGQIIYGNLSYYGPVRLVEYPSV